MASSSPAGSLNRAGSPAITTSPYSAGALSSSRRRSSASARSACTTVALSFQRRGALRVRPIADHQARAFGRQQFRDRAAEPAGAARQHDLAAAAASQALAASRSPAFDRVERHVSARHRRQEHGEHFAIPQVQLEEALHQHGDDHRDAEVQRELDVAPLRPPVCRAARKKSQGIWNSIHISASMVGMPRSAA